jgi:hypothetical protein
MNRLTLKNDRLKFKSSRKVPIILEEYVWNILELIREKAEISQYVTGWTWKQLGSWPTLLKSLPETLDTHTHAAKLRPYFAFLVFPLTRLLYNRNTCTRPPVGPSILPSTPISTLISIHPSIRSTIHPPIHCVAYHHSS